MTDRERWTVYPLLFLALGIAVKDKMFRYVATDRVEAREMVIVDKDGVQSTVLTSEGIQAKNVTAVQNVRGQNLVGKALVVIDGTGRNLVEVASTKGGGVLRANGDQVDVVVGHADEVAGLFVVDHKGNVLRRASILVPTKPETPDGAEAPQEGEAPATENVPADVQAPSADVGTAEQKSPEAETQPAAEPQPETKSEAPDAVSPTAEPAAQPE
jgi:hypothetical protein